MYNLWQQLLFSHNIPKLRKLKNNIYRKLTYNASVMDMYKTTNYKYLFPYENDFDSLNKIDMINEFRQMYISSNK
jgi:hypothetical protein